MSCLNNLHQLGIGIEQYIDSNNGEYPFTYHAGNSQTWIATLAPYLEHVNDVRLCPDDPMGAARVQANVAGLSGTSYVINEYLADTTSDGYSVQNAKWISNKTQLIVLFEGADTGRTVQGDHVHTSTWFCAGRHSEWNGVGHHRRRDQPLAAHRRRQLSIRRRSRGNRLGKNLCRLVQPKYRHENEFCATDQKLMRPIHQPTSSLNHE